MFKLKLKKLTYATCDENLTRIFVETVYIRLFVRDFPNNSFSIHILVHTYSKLYNTQQFQVFDKI
jgi:hypothetical protein